MMMCGNIIRRTTAEKCNGFVFAFFFFCLLGGEGVFYWTFITELFKGGCVSMAGEKWCRVETT